MSLVLECKRNLFLNYVFHNISYIVQNKINVIKEDAKHGLLHSSQARFDWREHSVNCFPGHPTYLLVQEKGHPHI